jgi:large subunit ribosomal protein L17
VRHRVYGKHLGRDKNARTALFKSLVGSLILHGSIDTTETKAKAIKGLVDKIITQAKSKDTQRLLQTFLSQKDIREKLVKEIAPNLKDRNSGYTSTVRLGTRAGDGAMVVRMSLLVKEDSKVKKEEKQVAEPVVASETEEKAEITEVKAEKAVAKKAPRKAAKK